MLTLYFTPGASSMAPHIALLSIFAEFETDVRRERQLESIAMAKRQGVYKGIARSSVYRLLQEEAERR
jgi:DNA invertase Pin-like site-specific DNA recombinase